MNKDKQIKTTDWLTRGISKEQLERKKREAIMSADLQECITYDEWSAREYGIDSIDFDTTAEKMVAKGYHKQSEGEWLPDMEWFDEEEGISAKAGFYQTGWKCSLCGRNEYEKEPYCNCGAKMKGGAE